MSDGTMPAPFEHISIHVCGFACGDMWIEYTGKPCDLVAAGIVDETMQHKIANQRRGKRTDAQGRRFTVMNRDRSAADCWKRDDSVTLRRLCYVSELHELPGMREMFPDGYSDPEQEEYARKSDLLRAQHERLDKYENVNRAMHRSERNNLPMRSRQVGRKRLAARWYVDGNVILVDWTKIARKQLLAG